MSYADPSYRSWPLTVTTDRGGANAGGRVRGDCVLILTDHSLFDYA